MKLAALAWSLVVLLACAAAAAEDTRIGTIKTLKGDARIIAGGGSVAATVGGAVRQNDTLETGLVFRAIGEQQRSCWRDWPILVRGSPPSIS